jgi:hypothetical protein
MLTLASGQGHQQPPLRADLEVHAAVHVADPGVAVHVHLQPVRALARPFRQRHGIVGPRLQHLAALVEFHHGPPAPVGHPDVALPIDVHAGPFTHVVALRQGRPIRHEFVGKLRPVLELRHRCFNLIRIGAVGRPCRRGAGASGASSPAGGRGRRLRLAREVNDHGREEKKHCQKPLDFHCAHVTTPYDGHGSREANASRKIFFR